MKYFEAKETTWVWLAPRETIEHSTASKVSEDKFHEGDKPKLMKYDTCNVRSPKVLQVCNISLLQDCFQHRIVNSYIDEILGISLHHLKE
jgi:hypothetical protein